MTDERAGTGGNQTSPGEYSFLLNSQNILESGS